MNTNKTTSVIYEFTGAEIPVIRNLMRHHVITYVQVSWSVTNDEEPYLDYTLRGFDCKSDGTVDKRQKRASYVSLAIEETYAILENLVEKLDEPEMLEYISDSLKRFEIQKQRRLKEILNANETNSTDD